MIFSRSSGILLPISSLPSNYGIGDLGPDAYRFVDWLKTAHQSLWQILPFSIADDEGCPYSSVSAYGGYPLLISPEKMIEDNLLKKTDLKDASDLFGDYVHYDLVKEYKYFLFRKAFEKFNKQKRSILKKHFNSFIEEEKSWLDDLALFQVLSEQFGNNWLEWPEDYRNRNGAALEKFNQKNDDEINFYKFLQYIFFRQWQHLKDYANDHGVTIIGDIPIFLSHHSMDVWRDQQYFLLAGGEPYVVTGAPPDSFSPTGQKWGNPNYNWWEMEQNGFQWWISRIAFNLRHYDIVRLDHFRGFAATWEIPADNPDPRSGYWSRVPGENLFHCIGEALGELPLIVEDLGKITPDVHWLRDRFGFPGMKVLQFAFDEGDYNAHLPHNFTTNHCVVYTGTHDNSTAKGWFGNLGDTLERAYCEKYTGAWNHEHMNWTLIHTAMHTRADIAIIPLQDIMGLGDEARINTPGTPKGNWQWRFSWEDLHEHDKEHLKRITFESHRN